MEKIQPNRTTLFHLIQLDPKWTRENISSTPQSKHGSKPSDTHPLKQQQITTSNLPTVRSHNMVSLPEVQVKLNNQTRQRSSQTCTVFKTNTQSTSFVQLFHFVGFSFQCKQVFITLHSTKVFTTFNLLTHREFISHVHCAPGLFNALRLSHKTLLASQQDAYGTTSAQCTDSPRITTKNSSYKYASPQISHSHKSHSF